MAGGDHGWQRLMLPIMGAWTAGWFAPGYAPDGCRSCTKQTGMRLDSE